MSLTENRNQGFFLGLEIIVHSYMQSLSHYLQFRVKCNIRYADEPKCIALISVIDVYDYIKHLKLN